MSRLGLTLTLVASSIAVAQECFECLERANQSIEASATSASPERELREAQAQAQKGCRSGHQPACEVSRWLDPALREFERASKVETARQVLAARRCIESLRWDGLRGDAEVRVASWCAPVLDACRAGLMNSIGLAAGVDRTTIVGMSCAEKVCPSPEVAPSACFKPRDTTEYRITAASDVVALLAVVFKKALPAPVANELTAAFARPRHPFFKDAKPRNHTRAELEKALAVAQRLVKRGKDLPEVGQAIDDLLGMAHMEEEAQEAFWFASTGKACVALRLGFARLELDVRTLPTSACKLE